MAEKDDTNETGEGKEPTKKATRRRASRSRKTAVAEAPTSEPAVAVEAMPVAAAVAAEEAPAAVAAQGEAPSDADLYTAAFEVRPDFRDVSATLRGAMGAKGDVGVDTVCIRLPRVVKGVDVSGFKARVHYVNAVGRLDCADVQLKADGADGLKAEWLLGAVACEADGALAFSLELTEYAADGETVERRWSSSVNSELKVKPSYRAESALAPTVVEDLVRRLRDGLAASGKATSAAEAATKECRSATAAANESKAALDAATESVKAMLPLGLYLDEDGYICQREED